MTKKKEHRAADPADKLPKTHPKKTGKRGIKPLDPVEDFNTPLKKDPPAQAELLKVPAQPPSTIQHGRMSMHFVKYIPDRDKNRNRIVTINLALELEDAHKGRLPREIEDAWDDLKKGSVKRINPDGIGNQQLDIAIVPGEKSDIRIVATVKRASISRIKAKGKGKTRSITRLALSFVSSFDADLERFCHNNYDENLFVKLEESQMSFEEAEEDE